MAIQIYFNKTVTAAVVGVFCTIAYLGSAKADTIDEIEGIGGAMPIPNTTGMRVLTPTLLEIARVNTQPQGGVPDSWNFVTSATFTAPAPETFVVKVGETVIPAVIHSFRRRPLYAPLKVRDLRIDNRIFLALQQPLPEGAAVTVTTTGWDGPDVEKQYQATAAPLRRSAAIHVNQEGYATNFSKQAMVGYFLGSAGELVVPSTNFSLIDETTGLPVFNRNLTLRADFGYAYTPTPYQKVWMADFTAFTTPGTYRLSVPGLGASLPFRISDNMMMNFVRTYAQGLYNQRCGHAVELPYSRHVHAACHTAAAEIPLPQASYGNTWSYIASANYGATNQLASETTQLYPILKRGTIDVSGGHHDAGDYSKYTINSAQLVHHLAFAVDAFPGVGAMDNLGIPESGDGKSDLLQEAKIEGDFLAKMQDDDGGFFFLVYPKLRKYEDNVLPDQGDTQVVWPKNTAATAAAVGALADLGSSPLFKQQFPEASALYLQKAQAGWNFLLNAIATYGKTGSYQKITHYGDNFIHDDELAWAAASMFAATGDPVCQQKLIEWYNPLATSTRRWGWWHMFEAYGCAARSYAFAVRSGKRTSGEMDATYLNSMNLALKNAADAILERSGQGAYGSSLDVSSKRQNTAGWYFSVDRAFDMSVGQILNPSPSYLTATANNTNFEFGCNPLNLSYVTGAGQRQQREIVHQYAQNDYRILPPSGIPLGNIQAGFSWTARYGSELGSLTFPHDGAPNGKYPFYDRWGDTFNTMTEFVVVQQARGLACLASLAANLPGATTPWKPTAATINIPAGFATVGVPLTVSVECPGLDLTEARVTWECGDQEPVFGEYQHTFIPLKSCQQWIEAEVLLPDGRRFSTTAVFAVKAAQGDSEKLVENNTIALYHFNGNFNDSSPNKFNLTASGNVKFEAQATGWMSNPSGQAVRFSDIGDYLTVTIPDSYISPGNTCTPLALEAWICPIGYKAYGRSISPAFSLDQGWDGKFGAGQDLWLVPSCPYITAGRTPLLSSTQWQNAVTLGTWQHLKITRDSAGNHQVLINGVVVSSANATYNYGSTGNWILNLGNFNGYMDEVRISGMPNYGVSTTVATGGSGGSGTTTTTTTTPAIPLTTTVASPFLANYETDSNTVALYHFDGNYQDSGPNALHLTPRGNATRVPSIARDSSSSGEAVRLRNIGDGLSVTIPDALVAPTNSATEFTMEAWIFPRAYKGYGYSAGIMCLGQNYDSSMSIYQDKWLKPAAPIISTGSTTLVSNTTWNSTVKLGVWQHIRLTRDLTGTARVWLDGVCIAALKAPLAYGRVNDWSFSIGDIDADIDEVRLSKVVRGNDSPDEYKADANTVALYHFSGDYQDSTINGLHLTATGNTTLTNQNLTWMAQPSGQAVRFQNAGDGLTVSIPNSVITGSGNTGELTIEAEIYIRSYKAWSAGGNIVHLYQTPDNYLSLVQNPLAQPAVASVVSSGGTIVSNSLWNTTVATGIWQPLKLTRSANGEVKCWISDICIATEMAPALNETGNWTFKLGDIDADIDEVRISNIIR